MATLHIVLSSDARLQGQTIPLAAGTLAIGRDPSVGIAIADTSVSRLHASITAEADGYVIVDEGSANGVWVNGQRVESRLLASGDTIVIGGTTFRFEESVETMKTVVLELPPAGRQPAAAPPQIPQHVPPQAAPSAPPSSLPAPVPVAPQVSPPPLPAQQSSQAPVQAPVPPPRARASGCAVGCLVASILLFFGTIATSLYLLYRAGYLPGVS